ncbi:MAG: S1 RNA-binding domain-containing protein [Planctomycetota bacterium]
MTEKSPVEAAVASRVAERFKLDPTLVARALELLGRGLPVPYLARYRRDAVGGLTERELRALRAEADQLTELEQRRAFILRAVDGRDDVPEKTRKRIEKCRIRTELEYLYEPFRPPRKTPASVARERGLEVLADALLTGAAIEADKYVDAENGVNSADDALAGARTILSERFGVDPTVRMTLLRVIEKEGVLTTAPPVGKDKIGGRFSQYANYEEKLARAPSHRFLALHRAKADGALTIRLAFSEEKVLAAIAERFFPKGECDEAAKAQLDLAAADAVRLMRSAVVEDALSHAKDRADSEAIKIFCTNLADLLAYPPAGGLRVMGVDPAPRGAIPVACVDQRGTHLEHARLKFFDKNEEKAAAARAEIARLVKTHDVQLIALGNGQGRHNCEAFLRSALSGLESPPAIVVTNEVGVGTYAGGPVGRAELPALPVPVRGAVSLARRAMDPLRELVKVDPQQIGVGQYQSDVDAGRLSRALRDVVQHCVCWVGVDVNRAPAQQIAYVCGITPSTARAIVAHREKAGPFRTRAALKELPVVSDTAFEHAGGFLRIRDGDNLLDATGVHPSHYPVVERIAEATGVAPGELVGNTDVLAPVVAEEFADAEFSPATVAAILFELTEAGADPRPRLEVIARPAGVDSAADLKEGMRLSGRVTNVTNFGAFVDLGVQQDGLVHVSELADRFVKDPTTVAHVGQIVEVRVLGVDSNTGRISLSMKSGRPPARGRGRDDKGGRRPQRGRRPRRDERRDSEDRGERPAADTPAEAPAQAAEPDTAPVAENPVPSDMTEEEFIQSKLDELRRRFS